MEICRFQGNIHNLHAMTKSIGLMVLYLAQTKSIHMVIFLHGKKLETSNSGLSVLSHSLSTRQEKGPFKFSYVMDNSQMISVRAVF